MSQQDVLWGVLEKVFNQSNRIPERQKGQRRLCHKAMQTRQTTGVFQPFRNASIEPVNNNNKKANAQTIQQLGERAIESFIVVAYSINAEIRHMSIRSNAVLTRQAAQDKFNYFGPRRYIWDIPAAPQSR